MLAPIVDPLTAQLAAARAGAAPVRRPFVTLAYAQTLDGSIAAERGKKLAVSGADATTLTHALRARHDAILVGVETVLADDPQLTVRLCPGASPQPIVLDSRLRTPEAAALFAPAGSPRRGPALIATTPAADPRSEARLRSRGARVVRVGAIANGWVDVPALLGALRELGVTSVMVEGGARVLTSFLAAGTVDHAVITVAPRFLGGLAAVGPLDRVAPPRLRDWTTHRIGEDLVLAGAVEAARA